MKYSLVTYGCQANERDSEIIAGLLIDIGYTQAAQQDEADVIIFNTCCVRDKAEHKVFSQIGALKQRKAQNPDLIIGIGGCMTQQDGILEKIRRRLPHVDLVFGTHNKHELPAMLRELQQKRIRQIRIKEESAIVEGLPSKREFSFKGLVHITYGCNNFCTYCIVPYVRGREVSRKPADILAEIRQMAAEGVLEVMLLGQNVNSYGKDLAPPVSFADLLRQVNEIEGIRRIRYMTSHPRDFSDALLAAMEETGKVCPHFHLPVQSGSNTILQRMNRGYTREDYFRLAGKIRAAFPAASLTTDLIVGFPGETEEDFLDTLDMVEKVRFDSAFTFVYSPRAGTPAAVMQGQVEAAEKKERLKRLMKLQDGISLEKNKKLQGQIMEVLVEGFSKTSQEMLTGRTATNKAVLFPGPASLTGQFAHVRITAPQTWVLKGELT